MLSPGNGNGIFLMIYSVCCLHWKQTKKTLGYIKVRCTISFSLNSNDVQVVKKQYLYKISRISIDIRRLVHSDVETNHLDRSILLFIALFLWFHSDLLNFH